MAPKAPPFPFQKKGAADPKAAKRAAMNKGKLPGLDKLPRAKRDNPNDSPAMEARERRQGIKT